MSIRIISMAKHPNNEILICGDFNGIVYRMNKNLEILDRSSPVPGHVSTLYKIVCNDQFIFGRDIKGNLIQWDIETLEVKQIIFLKHFTNEEQKKKYSPIPTASHGLFLFKSYLLVVNPFGELLQFNQKDLSYIKKIDLPVEAFAESFSYRDDQEQIVCDCIGNLWVGSFENKAFEKKTRLDYGPVHAMQYDQKNDRYWLTTDNHRGFSIVSHDFEKITRFQMTNDDVEWLTFNEDYSLAYLVCFDHHLYIYKNEVNPQLIARVGPLKFQGKQVEVIDENHVYVLLESGEIYHIDKHHRMVKQAVTGTNCAWDMVEDKEVKNQYILPMEDGSIRYVRYFASIDQQKVELFETKTIPNLGMGRVRRVVPLGGGSLLIGTSQGYVAKISSEGGLVWWYRTRSIVRDIAFNQAQKLAAVVNEAGEVLLFHIETGEVTWQDTFDKPLWAACFYDNDLLVSERCLSEKDENKTSSVPIANLYQIDISKKEIKLSIAICGNIKRIQVLENGHLLLNGNGDIFTLEYDLNQRKAVKRWDEWQLNTCEKAIQFAGKVYGVTYGYQLNTYEMNGKMIDCQFSPVNYPKAVVAGETIEQKPLILVAGRGAFVSLYLLNEAGIPDLAKTIFLH